MFKNKSIIYIFVLFLIFSLTLPYSYILGVDSDSVYVWSENVPTSNTDEITPQEEQQSRKFFKFSFS